MKKYLLTLLATICLMTTIIMPIHAEDSVTMYRLYNPNSGEHFYTAKAEEKDYLVKVGWNDEGIGWYAPQTGDPVYRVYNPNSGDHHYTLNEGEKNALVKLGWKDEGIGWYSVSDGDRLPLYRQYNPNALTGNHNYTLAVAEKDNLVSVGWSDEGIGWYAVNVPTTEPEPTVTPTVTPVPTSSPSTTTDSKNEPDRYAPKYKVLHEGETCESGVLDANGFCHVGVCMSFDEVVNAEREWKKTHNISMNSTFGDTDIDGCWVLHWNDDSFSVGDD